MASREKKLHSVENSIAPNLPTALGQPVAINLGVDFGTSFTKVSFRDVGTEETSLVTFGARTPEGSMIPSIVIVGHDDRLSLASTSTRNAGNEIRYLKMRLADVAIPASLPPTVEMDLSNPEVVRALSSWFLATVVSRARAWILHQQEERIRGRTVQWSANVGVPVEHYDSPAIEVFRKVLSVAWAWVTENKIPTHLQDAVTTYRYTVQSIEPDSSDCHAIPEIAAAVQSFLTSREAEPGIYIYFDIGGGTVDGVAFNYVNWNGERRINFYSGKVAPLGVASIASRLGSADAFEASIMTNKLTPSLHEILGPVSREVQRLVAEVVMLAKRKDGRNWQRHGIQNTARPRDTLARLDPSQMKPLLIFVGGGGAGSKWYQSTILRTYKDFGHANAGIPPYELTEVPKPADLDMAGIDAHFFRRFTVAYGLSVPFGEGPEIGLPSHFEMAPPREAWQPKGVVDYFDSKDAYD